VVVVASPEPLIQESPASEAPGAVGWGVLRLVQRWPDDETATDEHSGTWPADAPPARHQPPHLTLVPPSLPRFDRRAASVALHQVLVEWRLGVRELDRIAEGGLEWSRRWAEVSALRDAYHRLFSEIRRSAGP
jgi:hypothetical protein